MGEFFQALGTYRFLQYAMVTGVLSSISCGIVGSYITVRRITYVAAAIAHATLGGMGVARFLEREMGWAFMSPFNGALAAGLLAAVIVGFVTVYGKQREDTVLSAVWSIGMAVGIIFISRTGGYNEDLMSYLFGNILMVSKQELFVMAVLDVFILAVTVLFYNKLSAVCFDEEFARLRGIRVQLYYIMLLVMTALTVVMLLTIVGIVMVIAILTLPPAAASLLSKKLWQNMVVAGCLTVLFMVGGLVLSYRPNLPAGATIIVVAGVAYMLLLVGRPLWQRRRRRRASKIGVR